MVLQLAEGYYGNLTIYDDIVAGRLVTPLRVRAEEGRQIIRVPEIVEPVANFSLVVRGASMALAALLQSGDIDYIFDYESVVRQQKFRLLAFPEEIDLGSERFAGDYAKVRVSLEFQRFAQIKPEFDGRVIGYGVTVPSNAPHPELARGS